MSDNKNSTFFSVPPEGGIGGGNRNTKIKAAVAHVCRLLLGATFIFSGFVKVIDPLGTTYKIEDYLAAMGPLSVLAPLAFPAALCLVTFEFVLGLSLLCNLKKDLMPWLALAMIAVMTPLTLWIALTNPVTDCGCFGDALVISNWATFWKNIVLLALIIALLVLKKYTYAVFRPAVEWGIIGLFGLVSIFISVWCLHHLPLIDFRPYKVGTDIVAAMEIPDDAEEPEYAYTFIYEKDGEQREFTLDNYPKGDSTWTFVDQRTTLIKPGYEPPIHDFSIVRADDFEDITDDILTGDRTTVLIIMYDLKKTDKWQARRLARLYDALGEADFDVYALTGSGADEIEAFAELTGANYPFCFTDPVTLKTIVRANPGVVVIRDGRVAVKRNMRQVSSLTDLAH